MGPSLRRDDVVEALRFDNIVIARVATDSRVFIPSPLR